MDNEKSPYTAGDVVILNSSPYIPMTVEECFSVNNKFVVNVRYLDSSGNVLIKGFPANMLSLYRPSTDFIQPIGFKKDNPE